MSKKTKMTPGVREVRCLPHHMHWARGLLIVKLRRDIKWEEFCAIIGMNTRIVDYIKAGERPGGRTTVRKIIEGLRKHDVVIHLSDFYIEDANLESSQKWLRWKDYTR